MTVAELVDALCGLPSNAEVVIVHPEWPIKNIEVNKDKVTLK